MSVGRVDGYGYWAGRQAHLRLTTPAGRSDEETATVSYASTLNTSYRSRRLDNWHDDITRLAPNGKPLNIFKTLANHPDLMKRWIVFGNHVLSKSTLPARERELAILRIGWLCQSEYEFGQHNRIGLDCGMTEDEIVAVTKPIADGTGARRTLRS